MSATYLDELNAAQREAVAHGDGPLLIVAGAGTGKTKTLACRVAHLIDRGVRPERILLLTFTRRAAQEMLSRAANMAAVEVRNRVWGGTFHAVANRLLRMYGRAVGLAPGFTVMDQADAADLMNLVRNDLGVAKKDKRFPRKQTLVGIYSRMVNGQDPLDEVLGRYFPWCEADAEGIRLIFDGYAERKSRNNTLDYDDLLLYWSALCDDAEVGPRVAGMFDHVLVDEYQDTNLIQAEILLKMRRENRNLCVVGDDAQSIYSFRGATVRNILDFPSQFDAARIVRLEQNYRSTRPILAASNAVMAHAAERYTKELWSRRESDQKPALHTCLDEDEQSHIVVDRIIAHLEEGIPLHRQAVLFRAGHHSSHLEVELARRNIPFHKYGGLKFVESAHIKDLVAFLRVLDNPFDELSWFRILLLLDGIGPRTARRVIGDLGVTPRSEAAGNGTATPLRRLIESPPSVPPAARASFGQLRVTLGECVACGVEGESEGSGETGPAVSVQVERLRRFYDPICQRVHENARIRMRDIEQLEQIAQRYRSRSSFLADLALDPPTSTADLAGPPFLEEDYLNLSTIHSAKGCEWDVVYVIHAADGMIPSDMATDSEASVDEERRLFYVAMTRARDTLYVMVPLRYYHRWSARGDAHSYAQVTRFIPEQDRSFYALRSVEAGADDAVPDVSWSRRSVSARVRRLWQD